jgi:predicted amidophosphoribosyltransferase
VRAVLLAHKEQGAMGLGEPLGRALAGAVEAAVRSGTGARALLRVPVPSARRAVAARGHDAGRRIAFAAARELRRRGRSAQVVPVLRQRRAVADQAGLSARGRLMNLSGALEVPVGGDRLLGGSGRGVPGRGGGVVLVDDLVTTGASLAEAARAVRAALGGDRGEESRAGYPPLVAAAVAASSARQGP